MDPQNKRSATCAGVGNAHAYQQSTMLLDLPENIIAAILQHLPFVSTLSAESFCKAFRRLLAKSDVWGCINVLHEDLGRANHINMAR